MITEDYVSFETAKLLKEKGFDEFTFSYYSNDGLIGFMEVETRISDGYQRPTLQMAMKWLRERYNLYIVPYPEDNSTWYLIYPKQVKQCNGKYDDCSYSTYEEACESAIKYCLENLI